MRTYRFLTALRVAALVLCSAGPAAADITLAWDPPSDPSVVGYVVVYGMSSGVYTTQLNVGNVTTALVPITDTSRTYYLAVKSYDVNGTLSAPSNEVTYGPVCTSASPSIAIAPGTTVSVLAGASQSYAVTVLNNDSAGCSPSTFSNDTAAPSGWTTVWTASTESIAPGSSASTTLSITSPAAAAGQYSIPVTVTNLNSAGLTKSTIVERILAPLSVSVTTDQTTYSAGRRMTVRAAVMEGATSMRGVPVTITISGPFGNVVGTWTATTDRTGSAKIALRAPSPAGTYQVAATVTTSVSGTVLTATAASTFVVQ